MALVGRNTRVEVQKTVASSKTITAITKASPGVVSSTAHGYSNGDYVVLTIAGMSELDGQIVRVASSTTDAWSIESVDTTSYGTFTSGTSNKITAWSTISEATSFDAGSTQPQELDATTLLDSEQQIQLGVTPKPQITVQLFSAPLAEAQGLVNTAGVNAATVAFRVTMSDGSIRILRGQPSTISESIQVNALVTGQFSIAQKRQKLSFAS